MATVIAEFCQNHRGDIKTLKEMVRAAAEAGADYAKIQSMLAGDLTFRERFEEGKTTGGKTTVIKRPYKPEYDRLRPMDLDDTAHHIFIDECKAAGIKPLTTVFSRSRIPFLSSLPWQDIKTASYDCASYPMIKELAKRFKHLYISTGATYDSEIEETAKILKGRSFSFLHCVTIYPTPLDSLNLSRLDYLRKFTPSVGFSDHTLVERDGIIASVAALSCGADVIERHFTILDRKLTRDGPVSVDPKQLKELVSFAKMKRSEVEEYVEKNVPDKGKMIGAPQQPLSETELLNRDYYRGRFASRFREKIVYNWEDEPAF